MKQLIETIEKLRSRNIGFRSLMEAIDTTTAQGVLVFHMFSALAEFERALIRERTRAGLAAAKRAGRTGGRPRRCEDVALQSRYLPSAMLPTVSGCRPRRCIATFPLRGRRMPQAVENFWSIADFSHSALHGNARLSEAAIASP
jgi:hypothetical protein